MTPLLLDTCAAIWLAEESPIAKAAEAALAHAQADAIPVYISPISGLEVGMLVANNRLKLPLEPMAWFDRLLAKPTRRLADLSLRILVASSCLPGRPPRDPMDRIIIATARQGGFCVMTRDGRILEYAEQGHVQAVAC